MTITTGEYSDYSVSGVFRAKEEIDADKLLADWLKDNPEQVADYHFNANEFLGWVVRQGLVEPVDSFEWYLGAYSCAEGMSVEAMDSTVLK